jgi:hypothetical protein
MKTKYVPSVSALARELRLSRQWTTELFRLPGHPKPTKSGHDLAKWKKWLADRAEKHESTAGEKSRLELELLRKRIHRVDLEISTLDNSRQEEIADRITDECGKIIGVLSEALQRMPTELSGIFSMLAEPVSIYKRFKTEMCNRFEVAHKALQKVKAESRKKNNIVPFAASANGANGSKAA